MQLRYCKRLDADIVRLDKMGELYIQVVVAGDRDSLAKATGLGEQADQALGEISKLGAVESEDLRHQRHAAEHEA